MISCSILFLSLSFDSSSLEILALEVLRNGLGDADLMSLKQSKQGCVLSNMP